MPEAFYLKHQETDKETGKSKKEVRILHGQSGSQTRLPPRIPDPRQVRGDLESEEISGPILNLRRLRHCHSEGFIGQLSTNQG